MELSISENSQDKIKIKIPYDEEDVNKIRSLPGRRWNPEYKYWIIPNTKNTLKKLLTLFHDKKIKIFSNLEFFDGKQYIIDYYKKFYSNKLHKLLKLKGYSPKTQNVYLSHLRSFIRFIDTDPAVISIKEINNYILYLIEDKENSHSFANQYISMIKIFLTDILKRDSDSINIIRPQKKKKLPVVLSKDEVKSIINSLQNIKHQTILSIVYSAGLRVS